MKRMDALPKRFRLLGGMDLSTLLLRNETLEIEYQSFSGTRVEQECKIRKGR